MGEKPNDADSTEFSTILSKQLKFHHSSHNSKLYWFQEVNKYVALQVFYPEVRYSKALKYFYWNVIILKDLNIFTELLCYTLETNTTLQINYMHTSVKKNKYFK